MNNIQAYLSSLNSGGAQSRPKPGGQRPRPVPPKENPWIPPRERPIDRPRPIRPPEAAGGGMSVHGWPADRPQPRPQPGGQKPGASASPRPGVTAHGTIPPKKNPWIPPRERPIDRPAQRPPIAAQPTPAPTAPPTEWWKRNPSDITELLRQLSVNAGQMGMPGGNVGAVQKPAFGTMGQAVIPQDMRTYGQAPNMGEATFFQQSMNGGMAPIAAMSPLGVPAGWNPLGNQTGAKPKPSNNPSKISKEDAIRREMRLLAGALPSVSMGMFDPRKLIGNIR